jgi:hypothetical protein
VVTKLLTVDALCIKVEFEAVFNSESFGKGAKAGLGGKVFSFGTSSDDGDRGG